MEKDYITITGTEYYFGNIVFKVGDKFYAKVCFVTGTSVIVEVLKRDENNHKNNRKIHK